MKTKSIAGLLGVAASVLLLGARCNDQVSNSDRSNAGASGERNERSERVVPNVERAPSDQAGKGNSNVSPGRDPAAQPSSPQP